MGGAFEKKKDTSHKRSALPKKRNSKPAERKGDLFLLGKKKKKVEPNSLNRAASRKRSTTITPERNPSKKDSTLLVDGGKKTGLSITSAGRREVSVGGNFWRGSGTGPLEKGYSNGEGGGPKRSLLVAARCA